MLVISGASSLVLDAQVTLLWSHRFPGTTIFTGFGDVGTGLDLRHDSLLVGRTYENLSTTTLLNAGTGEEIWNTFLPDTVVQQGDIHFWPYGIIRNDRVAQWSGLIGITDIMGLDGDLQSQEADLGISVSRVCGPLITSDGQKAYSLSYGQGITVPELRGAIFDALNTITEWTNFPSLPWLAMHAVADDADGIVVTAMVQHPSAFSPVPQLARFDAGSGALLWKRYLTDTTGFLVNSDALSANWGNDTILTAFTTWSGLVELRMNRISDGTPLWSFTDTLGIIPSLSTLCVEPGERLVLLGTQNSFVLTYAIDEGRLWIDTLYTSPHYPGSVLLSNEDHLVHVLATGPGTGQGQDIRIRTFDKNTGHVTGDATWNDPISNTHDVLHGALLAHDTLYVLSASTFDTLNILNERTTVTVNAYLLGGTTGVAPMSLGETANTAVLAHDHIAGLLNPQVHSWTCFDLSGRYRFGASGEELDRHYRDLAPGLYLLVPSSGGQQRLFEKY